MRMRAAEPTVDAVQTLCQRVRSAGSPNARARPPLVTEYRRLAETLGVEGRGFYALMNNLQTGIDLQRAAAGLLRAAARAEAVAAQSPSARLRRAGRQTV